MQRIVRVAEHNAKGVTTFYVPSTSDENVTYSVKFIRRAGMRRWTRDRGSGPQRQSLIEERAMRRQTPVTSNRAMRKE